MKKMYLSCVMQVVNEEGEALIDRATKPKEKNGLTREWFEEQNLKVPEDLEDDEIERDEDGRIILDDKHLSYDSLAIAIPIKNIESYVEHSDMGTLINMKSGMLYHVYEEFEEVDEYHDFLNRNFWEVTRDSIKYLFRRKNKQLN